MDEEFIEIEELENELPVEQILDPTEQSADGSEILITGYVTREDFYSFKDELFEKLQTEEVISYSVWDKPLTEYTVSEGLLLGIFLGLIGKIIFDYVGGLFD